MDVGSNNEVLWGTEYNDNGMIVCFEGLKRERWYDSERYIEREKCCWERYYYERCFKSERYCERKGEVEIFKICRNYEEFIERLGGERSENNSKYLPGIEADIAAVGDDVDKIPDYD